MRIIGLTGRAGSGKTSVARTLENNGFTLIKFTEPLKAMLYAMGLSYEQIEGSQKEQPAAVLGGKTPRFAMQTLGTEWGRNLISPDLWANAWAQAVNDLLELEPETSIVCDDVRFLNEASIIKRMGGKIWRIVRDVPVSVHRSETELQLIDEDAVIANTSTLIELARTVEYLLESR